MLKMGDGISLDAAVQILKSHHQNDESDSSLPPTPFQSRWSDDSELLHAVDECASSKTWQ